MEQFSAKHSIIWPLLQRPALLAATAVVLLLLIALALLVAKSWHSVQRLEPIRFHTDVLNQLQAASQRAQFMLIESLRRSVTVRMDQLDTLRAEIAWVRTLSGYLVTQTADHLQNAEQALTAPAFRRRCWIAGCARSPATARRAQA